MRILVCGGRDYDNVQMVEKTLSAYRNQDLTIIEGGALGADRIAQNFAKQNKIKLETFQANWNLFGNRAGTIRNAQMLREGKPDLVIAFAGGRGTADMCRKARSAGIEVITPVDG